MKTIAEVVQERKLQQSQVRDRTAMTSEVNKGSHQSANNIVDSLEQIRGDMEHMSVKEREAVQSSMQEITGSMKKHIDTIKPQVGIPVSLQLDSLEVGNLHAPQFERLIQLFVQKLSSLETAVREITVEVPKVDVAAAQVHIPEIKIPTITVPKSSIKVELPTINMPKPTVIVQKEQADDNPIVRERYEYVNQQGIETLDSVTDYYKDGTKHIARGLSGTEVIHEYS